MRCRPRPPSVRSLSGALVSASLAGFARQEGMAGAEGQRLPWRTVAVVAVLIVLGLVYVAVGITESVMARYRMDKVPQFVLTSFALAFFATVITLEFLK